jgi:D-alanyl-D-alanine carboxypeptidase/D-alanyl-D-alanine-endopeptidase (penicillin-binding protein 4)
VVIEGQSRVSGEVVTLGEAMLRRVNWPQEEVAVVQSPPFSIIAAQTMKPSQNLYTELILRTLGALAPVPVPSPSPAPSPAASPSSAAAPSSTPAPSVLQQTSESLGLEVVRSFLKTAGLRPEALVLDDASGLSRGDMITAEATVQLLTFMDKHRFAAAFREALPIAGVDGTLRNRMKGTPAENNLRAKTGTLSSASSLSGYVTTAGGEKLAFAIMVNNYPRDLDVRTVCIEPIAVLLASFSGKPELSNSKPEPKDGP